MGGAPLPQVDSRPHGRWLAAPGLSHDAGPRLGVNPTLYILCFLGCFPHAMRLVLHGGPKQHMEGGWWHRAMGFAVLDRRGMHCAQFSATAWGCSGWHLCLRASMQA